MAKKGAVYEYLSKIGKKGGKASGKARLEKLTPEQRSEVARNAAAARWAKKAETGGAVARDQPLTPTQRKRIADKVANDPKWKNKSTGAKKITAPGERT
jgi:hypothetical protein